MVTNHRRYSYRTKTYLEFFPAETRRKIQHVPERDLLMYECHSHRLFMLLGRLLVFGTA